jgi:hypothetical protein
MMECVSLLYVGRTLIMNGAPKVMPPVLLCWPTALEADAGGMTVEVEPSRQWLVSFVVVWQMAAEEQYLSRR